ncbi:hypothetical protein [Streptomyces winkii]|uniref:hypothetical protein n=1 Tax=Streptomyces winkii TaxID=3051178 RepID=UPI0028D3427A|nr:hypothetical protein [Streptomyces sp. DSM 40971]
MNRHRFEPARLLLGLLLIGAAVTYAMDAFGEWRLPAWALIASVPLALLAAAFTAVATAAVRRLVRGLRKEAPGPLGAMPMDELRGGYERPGEGSGQRGDSAPGAPDRDGDD